MTIILTKEESAHCLKYSIEVKVNWLISIFSTSDQRQVLLKKSRKKSRKIAISLTASFYTITLHLGLGGGTLRIMAKLPFRGRPRPVSLP